VPRSARVEVFVGHRLGTRQTVIPFVETSTVCRAGWLGCDDLRRARSDRGTPV